VTSCPGGTLTIASRSASLPCFSLAFPSRAYQLSGSLHVLMHTSSHGAARAPSPQCLSLRSTARASHLRAVSPGLILGGQRTPSISAHGAPNAAKSMPISAAAHSCPASVSALTSRLLGPHIDLDHAMSSFEVSHATDRPRGPCLTTACHFIPQGCVINMTSTAPSSPRRPSRRPPAARPAPSALT
jgi:hypothetical protein